jgi:histone acetyltransferase (RNA polymerase elongator complex component)
MITGQERPYLSKGEIHDTVTTYLSYKDSRRGKVQISFYGGNFLGLDPSIIHSLLVDTAHFINIGKVDSLRFSTRPDTISSEKLDMLQKYPVSTIELGVQSMNDKVLRLIHRGHSARDTENAVYLLKQAGYEIGLQMMVGLPGEDHGHAIETAKKLAALSPDFVRIYPTIVLAGSPLANWYLEGKYSPMNLSPCITLVKELYILFHHHHIPVIRMGLQTNEMLNDPSAMLAGPYHPAFGHLVLSEFFLDKATFNIMSMPFLPRHISIRVHSQNIPKLRGYQNRNVGILKNRFNISFLKISSDNSLGIDEVIVSGL